MIKNTIVMTTVLTRARGTGRAACIVSESGHSIEYWSPEVTSRAVNDLVDAAVIELSGLLWRPVYTDEVAAVVSVSEGQTRRLLNESVRLVRMKEYRSARGVPWRPKRGPTRSDLRWAGRILAAEPRRSRGEDVLAALVEVEEFLRQGDLAEAAARLSPDMPATSPIKAISMTSRSRILWLRARSRADLLMQLGHAREASKIAEHAVELAENGEERAVCLTVLGAARRMVSVLRCQGNAGATGAYYAALREGEALAGTDREASRRVLRHVNAAITAPLLVIKKIRAALAHGEKSLALADTPDEVAESLLCLSRTYAHLGRRGDARRAWEGARDLKSGPVWLRQWLVRFEVTFASDDLTPEQLEDGLRRALAVAGDFGFQRRLVVARIAAVAHGLDPDRWPTDEIASLAGEIGADAQPRALRDLPSLIAPADQPGPMLST